MPNNAELLELELLSAQSRSSARRLDELLDEDFSEIGQSGELYNKQEIIEALLREQQLGPVLSRQVKDLHSRELSEDLILLTYFCEVHDLSASIKLRMSRRSSIWRKSGDSWKLLFHQGTPSSD
ncbi:MAG: nuclear transport factor 2 family protein [Pseudomonadota bacterium]|nr:nuclear transport factor 2 family protein [Pseudomonadota bacterium]